MTIGQVPSKSKLYLQSHWRQKQSGMYEVVSTTGGVPVTSTNRPGHFTILMSMLMANRPHTRRALKELSVYTVTGYLLGT